MHNLIKIEEGLKLDNKIFIDVRSPAEYEEATIPGAINVPLLEDQERTAVGTVYRNESIEKAKQLGISFASHKLPEIFKLINQFHTENRIVIIFCWRGGMRSKSVCSFLNSLNLSRVYQLVGGYKAYRKFVVEYLENKPKFFRFLMLHGLTGVGKTHILEELKRMGESILNLENLANNSGSVFGNILFCEKSPSQKQFESYIFNELYHAKRKTIFVESESKRIGNVQIPEPLFEKMMNGYHILIKTDIENRIRIIKKDYVNSNQDEKIIAAIGHLRKKVGHQLVEELILKIKNKVYDPVIRTLIDIYYDPLYKYSINKYEKYDLTVDYDIIAEVFPLLIEFSKSVEEESKGVLE